MPLADGDLGAVNVGWKQWKQIYLWPLLGAGITVLAVALLAVLSADSLDAYQAKADNSTATSRSASPFFAFVADHRGWLIFFLAVITTVPSVISVAKARKLRGDPQLEMLKRYLRLAQKRSFPEADGIAVKVRISLFVPEGDGDGIELKCVYRTDDTKAKEAWKVSNRKGFVTRVWLEQTTRDVGELLKGEADNAVRERYLSESWSDEESLKNRSWPGAAMIAVPITVRPGDHPVAVFLIEAHGIEIEELKQRKHDWDASMCCMLLEDPK